MTELFGGEFGVRDRGALQSCVAHPRMKAFGLTCYPSMAQKAAAYCFFIVMGHPFLDGNKRTGFMAALRFLHVNGLDPKIDETEAGDVILKIASTEGPDMASLISLFARGLEA